MNKYLNIKLKKINNIFEIDLAIIYSSMSKIVGAGGSLISVYLITKSFTPNEQGYYYTFISVLALQLFFELGLNTVITQFVAHEFSKLKIDENKSIVGDHYNISRLSSLFHLCIKIYSSVSVILFIILYIIGFLLFGTEKNNVISWQLPWILLCFSTSITFIINPFFSFLEGFNLIKEASKYRFIQYLVNLSVLWTALIYNLKLYSGGLAIFSASIVIIIILILKYKSIFKNLYNSLSNEKISYRKEIFPFQWRVAISWLSGTLFIQLFNPFVFKMYGSITAGQLGMSLSIINGISAISMNWIYTRIPKMAQFASLQQYKSLNKIFNKTLIQIIFISLITFTLTIILVYTLGVFSLNTKLLNIYAFTLLIMSSLITQISACYSTYYR